jgi:iron-sulfur cluster repair protein YtfE (RIC family)
MRKRKIQADSSSSSLSLENNLKENAAINLKITVTEKEIQPALYEQCFDNTAELSKAELILNAKILKVTMTIREQFPELIKYLEEVTDTIPDKKDPDINLKNLSAYYETLKSMLNEYILEQEVITNDNKIAKS